MRSGQVHSLAAGTGPVTAGHHLQRSGGFSFCGHYAGVRRSGRKAAACRDWCRSSLGESALQELAMAYSLSLAGAYLIMATGKVPELLL